MMWIKCNGCGQDTHPDLADCTCENCGACDWSEPFPDQFEKTPPADSNG